MAKCTYFFDKVTNKILGRHVHQVEDNTNPGHLKFADSDIVITDEVWEEIRNGRKWPQYLEAVTDQDPDNLDRVLAEEMPHSNNEYAPSFLRNTTQLERRPYFCLKVKTHPRLKKEEEQDRCRVYEVDTEGGITLDMEVTVKTTQNTIEDHKKDKEVKNISGTFLAECTYGILVPRDGVIHMQDGKSTFQWILPDTTMKEVVRCYVKDPNREILISKSLRVKCR